MKRPLLFHKNFALVTLASALGAIGGIAGGFALSFLVFDETGSTLASALILSIRLVPHILVPLLAAPLMDRLPRKPFLVGGDIAGGLIFAGMGAWLLLFKFSYTGYLFVSLILACLYAVDELAFNNIYPELIPRGLEEKGYAVSSMLYPVLRVVMLPLAAILLDTLGVGLMLLGQGALSLLAALTESLITLDESGRRARAPYSLSAWAGDIRDAARYLAQEKGLRSIYEYMAVTNGVASGSGPILVAFFRPFFGDGFQIGHGFDGGDLLQIGLQGRGSLRVAGLEIQRFFIHGDHFFHFRVGGFHGAGRHRLEILVQLTVHLLFQLGKRAEGAFLRRDLRPGDPVSVDGTVEILTEGDFVQRPVFRRGGGKHRNA